jgi:hypothetical protein
MEKEIVKLYKTKDLSWWQKFMQMYWFTPKSWLLEEFVFDGTNVTIKTKNGKKLTVERVDMTTKYSKDKYDRREFVVKSRYAKIKFKEIPGMLDDEQWQDICDILEASETTLSKFVGGVGKIIDNLK